MQNPLLFGLLLMISGAVLAYLGLPDKRGRSPFFMTRSGLVTIYPAIILAFFAVGMAEIIITVTAR